MDKLMAGVKSKSDNQRKKMNEKWKKKEYWWRWGCAYRQEKDKERAKNHNKKISQVKIEASESKINPNEYLHKHIYPPPQHTYI